MIFYSKLNNAFYSSELSESYEANNSWPDDAKEIEDSIYLNLLEEQAKGKDIRPDENGMPVLVEPVIDYQQQARQTKSLLLDEVNNAILPLQDAIDLDMATDEEKNSILALKKYRVLLNRVDTSKAPDIKWPKNPV